MLLDSCLMQYLSVHILTSLGLCFHYECNTITANMPRRSTPISIGENMRVNCAVCVMGWSGEFWSERYLSQHILTISWLQYDCIEIKG